VGLRDVTIATVGRAHGLRGEVSLILATDQPAERLVPGAVLATSDGGELTLAAVRQHQDRWLAAFAEIPDRTAAEQIRGLTLSLEVDPEAEREDDPDAWYASELIGLAAVSTTGHPYGTVADLEPYPAQDLLVVRVPSGDVVRVPFVSEFVPEVDVEGGRVVLDPPGGLFDPENAIDTGETH
jgi:16S rRNA processing protein RimM